jgi:hypothetical protein
MKTVLKGIKVPRKDLAKLSIAMTQLATVTVRDQQVIEEGKEPVTLNPELVDRFQQFKWWSTKNAATLKEIAEKEEASLYSEDDIKKISAYHNGRDLIMQAYAKRDSRGKPIIIQTKDGPSYDIPSKKEDAMMKALDKFNKEHQEVQVITERIKAKLEEPVVVMLVCCEFRDIPIVVNGSYMRMFDEILLNTPKLSWFGKRGK